MSDPVVGIEIVAYDPRWPLLYAAERARIAAVLGDAAESVEHIGSTSVPGLPAKPLIDILVTVARLGPADQYVRPFENLGYEYFPILGNAERYTFGKGTPHTHHIHVVQHGGEEHLRPVAFRDYLQAHPEVARQYGELKYALAERFRPDRRGYNQAKTDFIRSIEARARGVSG